MDKWTNLLETGETVHVIYLDFAKVFDKVPHHRLIAKCKALGIDGKVIRYVQAFLSGRKQRVLVNGFSSTWSDVASEVPQGRVMGSELFIVFINDMPSEISNFISLFADDAKLFDRSTEVNNAKSI